MRAGARDPQLTPVQPNRAIQVAGCERRDDRDNDGRGRESDNAAPERKLEHVERDIEMELGVLGSERRAVEVLENGLPARRGGCAAEDSDDGRDAVDREPTQRLDDLLVAIQLGVELRVDGTPAEGDLDAHKDRHRHREEPDEEQRDLRVPLGRQNLQVAELLEPQPIGVETRENEEQDDQRRKDDRCDREGQPCSRRRPVLRWLRSVRG